MEEPKIVINTVLKKEDYRKFLYIATFRRNKTIIPMLGLIALLGSLIISFNDVQFNLPKFVISWVLFFALTIIVVLIKVERKNAQRVKTDKTGTFDSVNTLKFYEDRIVMENEALKSTGELKYDQFFAVMESKDYFIFYFSVNQASLVRKIDIDDPSAFKKFIVEKFNSKFKRI